ncbi:hypothetical protein SUS17_3296 [Sphingomonas sp. S17]|nr:hypothetical protein SUS17_3296 [Sphingomonas sp. S17]
MPIRSRLSNGAVPTNGLAKSTGVLGSDGSDWPETAVVSKILAVVSDPIMIDGK